MANWFGLRFKRHQCTNQTKPDEWRWVVMWMNTIMNGNHYDVAKGAQYDQTQTHRYTRAYTGIRRNTREYSGTHRYIQAYIGIHWYSQTYIGTHRYSQTLIHQHTLNFYAPAHTKHHTQLRHRSTGLGVEARENMRYEFQINSENLCVIATTVLYM